jgi:hypothetical protein
MLPLTIGSPKLHGGGYTYAAASWAKTKNDNATIINFKEFFIINPV